MEEPTTLTKIIYQLIQTYNHLFWHLETRNNNTSPQASKSIQYQNTIGHCRTLITNLPTTNRHLHWRQALRWAKRQLPSFHQKAINAVATDLKLAWTTTTNLTVLPEARSPPVPSLPTPLFGETLPNSTEVDDVGRDNVGSWTRNFGVRPSIIEQLKITCSTSLILGETPRCLINYHLPKHRIHILGILDPSNRSSLWGMRM